jgi:hypothetical protein
MSLAAGNRAARPVTLLERPAVTHHYPHRLSRIVNPNEPPQLVHSEIDASRSTRMHAGGREDVTAYARYKRE